MKLISWNVNGIRSVFKKGFRDFVHEHRPDVLCLQETKAPPQTLDFELSEYSCYWNHAQRPGYAGTALLTKIKPRNVTCGTGIPKHDQEGRVLAAEFDDFHLVNVYVPNSKRELERLPYRTREWDVDFLKYLKALESQKPVVFCGDLNVAHQPIDLTYPENNIQNHGFTKEEREGFENLIRAGFKDTFREFYKEGGHYTWWSPLNNCRARDIGWRIDYFCISSVLRPRLQEAFILKNVMGSDHCPVGIVLEKRKE